MQDRRWLVSCVQCKRLLLRVARLGESELQALRGHVADCSPNELIGRLPGIEALLKFFRVEAAERET